MTASETVQFANIGDASHWFEVLQTSDKSQTAIMKLGPGQSSGDEAEAHEKSEQVLLVMEGEVIGEIGGEQKTMRKGDVVIIPAGVKHRFFNQSNKPVMTFNVYSPPEYPQGTVE
jgi:mannose-6-phosphate isomerase-like protein (cupin superfamily)